MANFEDHYEILQVSPSAEPEVIEAAYKKLAQKYHPDRNKSPAAEEMMKKINVAHDVLGDPTQRKRYHAEWLQKRENKTSSTRTRPPARPKPVVRPLRIRFSNMEPGQIKRTSFVISNAGGPYSKMWLSNPKSWLRVVNSHSTTSKGELPLEVEIEAEALDWGDTSTEYIHVKLDDVQTSVTVEIRMKSKPRSEPETSEQPKQIRQIWRTKSKRIGVIVFATVLLLLVIGLTIFFTSQTSTVDKERLVSSATATAIAFTSEDANSEDIYIMNFDGSNTRRLTNMGEGKKILYGISWSPINNRIVFDCVPYAKQFPFFWFSMCRIYSVNFDGSNLNNLTGNGLYDHDPMFSPDGSKIVFVSTRDGKQDIYTMNPDGKNLLRLTNDPADDWSPRWYPDGTKITFVSNRSGNDNIFIMDADGSNQRKLTTNQLKNSSPEWAPDGTKIAFAAGPNDTEPIFGNDDIFVIDIYGGNETKLTHALSKDYGQKWSPDGSKIAFVSYSDLVGRIYVIDSDGRNLRLLTSNMDGYSPDWSPDGAKIAFYSTVGGKTEIFTMNADGSDVRRLTSNGRNNRNPIWVTHH
jgi:TolB protein